jgi:hypothetical protein
MASSEAEAHLHYLAGRGEARKHLEGSLLLYSALYTRNASSTD